MKKVAVISNFLALYRQGIVNNLCKQTNPFYTFYTSKKSVAGIKVIDSAKADIDPFNGGIRWQFVKNVIIRNFLVWQFGVFKIALSRKNDALILLGNMYCLSTWFLAVIGRMTGKHVIMWTHGLKGGDKGLKLYLRLMFYRLSHDLFLYENRAKKLLMNEGFKNNNLHVIYNSLDYNTLSFYRNNYNSIKASELKSELFDDPSLPILIYTGRLLIAKKVNMLLEAVNELKKNGKDVNCLIVGDGEDKLKMQQFIKKYELSNVKLYGSCYDEEVLSCLIGMSDIMVSPGNVGLTVVHALSYGTPVISHNNFVNQMPEVEIIQEGITGSLFKENDIHDLKETIVVWLDKHKNNRDFVRNCCYQKIDTFYNPNYQTDVFNKVILRGIVKE